VLREGGISPRVATQRIEARKAGAEGAELLEIEPGDPVLTMARVAYDTGGRPIEYGSHCYPTRSYWFELVLTEL
jgi:DNA-binding GntR family transcriptional regulator